MKSIIIGQYLPGTSLLYRMDPRSKLYILFILMVTAFTIQEFPVMVGLLVVVLLSLQIGGISIKRVIRGLKPVLVLLMFTFSFQIMFIKTGPQLVDETLILTSYNILLVVGIVVFWYMTKKYVPSKFLYFLLTVVGIIVLLSTVHTPGANLLQTNLTIYTDGVMNAVFIMTRLIIIITLSTMLTLTTKPTDLNLGLEQMLKPLKYIKVNSEDIAMIISLALRYIPTLLDEANKIMLAQASRGVDFSEGKMKDKVMQIISLLVPMFIISFKRSDDLANAMETRNFVPRQKRTRLHVLTWHTIDTVMITISLLLMSSSIAWAIIS